MSRIAAVYEVWSPSPRAPLDWRCPRARRGEGETVQLQALVAHASFLHDVYRPYVVRTRTPPCTLSCYVYG